MRCIGLGASAWTWQVRMPGLQVYLKQYFELFSIFDDIDTG